MKHLAGLWKKPSQNIGKGYKSKLVQWRREETVARIDRPTRPDRARSLGYKAKQGFVMARVRVKKGARKRPKPAGGRRPKRAGRFFSLGKSKKLVAEEKAARKFPGLEVLNSYWVGADGTRTWYEIVLLDRSHPSVSRDRERGWIAGPQHTGRAFRARTSAGKKSRGLRKKGKGAEKIRPSLAANKRRGK
jgi:large subunit ribosomal protein L15e